MKAIFLIVASFLVSLAAAQPLWQQAGDFCISDRGSSNKTYFRLCGSGSDQFDSVIACQSHNRNVQAAVRDYGRAAFNAYMEPRKPGECRPPEGACIQFAGVPVYLTNKCNICRTVQLAGCYVGNISVGAGESQRAPHCVGTIQIVAKRGC